VEGWFLVADADPSVALHTLFPGCHGREPQRLCRLPAVSLKFCVQQDKRVAGTIPPLSVAPANKGGQSQPPSLLGWHYLFIRRFRQEMKIIPAAYLCWSRAI
jgi:hypothetical protein